jgi:DNA-directed RNA polymerase specialized sigma24 family protein
MSKDQENLSVWVNQYTTELYSWALHKVSNADLAADLVQDTFLAAAEKMDGIQRRQLAKNMVIQYIKPQNYRPLPQESE